MTRKIHIVGNWKMNQTSNDIDSFFKEMSGVVVKCQSWITPQSIHIPQVKKLGEDALGNMFQVGAQNCSHKTSGAFTGDVSPTSLKDIGVGFTLVGHSERRAIFNEGNQLLNQKTILALNEGLKVIFCVGETLEEREQGKTEEVVKTQLEEGLKGISAGQLTDVIIAYEPVWAIGTGVTATPKQAQDAHDFIRNKVLGSVGFKIDDVVILYGGSVKPDNVEELLNCTDIDGALVGGASLKPSDFMKLCQAGSKLN